MITRAAVVASVAVLLALTVAARAEDIIGVSAVVVKEVSGRLGRAAPRRLVVGADVFQNEEITTGGNSRTQLLFLDRSTITMGPDSRLVLDEAVYDPSAAGGGSLVVSASVGVFRFVSGALPSERYEIRTPHGKVGIRGSVIDLIVEAARTTLVLWQGVGFLSNAAGVTEVVDQPGHVVTLSAPEATPTPQAPASPGVLQALRALQPTTPGGSPLPLDVLEGRRGGVPVDRQDIRESLDAVPGTEKGSGGTHDLPPPQPDP